MSDLKKYSKSWIAIAGVMAMAWLACVKPVKDDLAEYVNPFIGATTNVDDAGVYHGLGKTYPGATTPFGMVQVSPNTITGGDNGSGYSYEHKTIEGFALTQMSGVGWFGDMGNFLVMPTAGKIKTAPGKENVRDGYRSKYDKSSEQASPGYYAVKLTDHNIKAELTAAPHSGMMRFTFPANEMSRIQIDLARRVGGTSTMQSVKVVDDHTIAGWMKCTPDGGGWGNGDGQANYTVYFYAQFSKPLTNYGVWTADIPEQWSRKRDDVTSDKYQKVISEASIIEKPTEVSGKHLGFFANFNTTDNEQIVLKTGISYNSINGAKENLESEIADWDFDLVKQSARRKWNDALAKVDITGGTKDEKISFYTALYHTMLDPRVFQDVDGNYAGGDGNPHRSKTFTKRTIFSGWDVFRSQMPLQTIINPVVVNDMVNSLVTLASEKDKTYLERWEMLNAYSGCMIGNPAVSVITDAYQKGIRNFDVNKAYQLSVNSVEKFGNGERGFTPEPFSIANTLEYGYFEWCVGQFASALGKKDDADKYYKRGQSYRNIFDKEKNWFRPKDSNGKWLAWPDSGRLTQWYGCIESNPYQQGWFVPHDVNGMVTLMGGKEHVLTDLSSFFDKAPENMMWNDYYNHPNEPVHHVPFLFNRLGAPWLTQKTTREICQRAYKNSVQGLVGNEDVGQMSAWYVLAATGLHPVCPGDPRYEITSPVFAKAVIKLDPKYASGKTFTITAENNSPKNIYIQSAQLNGKPYDKCFITHQVLTNGGELALVMGDKPNKNWGKN
ncbi:GH92 family glycosyl hydrolase [Pedobacter sandarakinus]|uniref:GH92 family glycosyl hydrolase n=1 Tax=Pedobacter sandarakinus TaxID=353156 RepID=UPI002246D936|nr:GH92 family glycosyl hydrolase [Pedobacter sandarakinus]MCX2574112.1 GH92 family glycosyl hydrolase [Pedobacter sandarakinus]